VREAFDRHVAEDYRQHNPGIPDGREAAVAWLLRMTSGSRVTMDVRRVLVDGDFAVVQLIGSQGPEDPGHAIMNIFRLEDGLIVEHWDVTQPIPTRTASGRSMG
jgi:predicted SnoaL-like aldol condensation-catalyzing enzyme